MSVYVEAVAEFSAEVITAAFKLARTDTARDGRYAPKPAEIRGYAARLSRDRVPARHGPLTSGFCPGCETPDLFIASNGRFRPFHRDGCAFMRADDALEQRWALETGAEIWRDGRAPGIASAAEKRRELMAAHTARMLGEGAAV